MVEQYGLNSKEAHETTKRMDVFGLFFRDRVFVEHQT
jgi:hypothetical protein